ncbi:MAG: ureidoglycolate lyase [Bradyrhizobium sp.]|jgi:ureidoglycolate lyase
MQRLAPEPLTKTAFAPFGDVVEIDGATPIEINQGFARRFNSLANIDVSANGAPVNISLFEARPRPQPIEIKLMERHPLGSQLFMPLQDRPWLVVVCADPHDPASYRAFTATGRQGVNYGRNVWHHPLLILGDGERFMVVDRVGQDNLEEVWLDQPLSLVVP